MFKWFVFLLISHWFDLFDEFYFGDVSSRDRSADRHCISAFFNAEMRPISISFVPNVWFTCTIRNRNHFMSDAKKGFENYRQKDNAVLKRAGRLLNWRLDRVRDSYPIFFVATSFELLVFLFQLNWPNTSHNDDSSFFKRWNELIAIVIKMIGRFDFIVCRWNVERFKSDRSVWHIKLRSVW